MILPTVFLGVGLILAAWHLARTLVTRRYETWMLFRKAVTKRSDQPIAYWICVAWLSAWVAGLGAGTIAALIATLEGSV